MDFVSTRGRAPAVDFAGALLGGLAPDGGLYTPAAWPRLTAEEIAGFAGRPYAEVAAFILTRFVGGLIGPADLRAACERAYGAFDHPAVTPLTQIAPDRFLLELFHGPSLAFKDIAMRLLAELYEHVLSRRGETLTVVCATSGDTGGAAAAAFAGAEHLRCVVLYPQGRISEAQRRFITGTAAGNVAAAAVQGDFDDCQALVKAMLADRCFAASTKLAAVNSINILRVIAQCVYHFVAGAALGSPARPMRFVTPTGNFGDAFAGWAARAMGLPIERIRLATNRNDILVRALRQGAFRRAPAIATTSPAMDIQAPSNFERLYFECAERNGEAVEIAFRALAGDGALPLSEVILDRMRELFDGEAVDDAETTGTMAAIWREAGRLIDPHTAVAVAAANRPGLGEDDGAPVVVLATAHPAKFPETVIAATGQRPAMPPSLHAVAGRPERFHRLPADLAAVKAFVAGVAAS